MLSRLNSTSRNVFTTEAAQAKFRAIQISTKNSILDYQSGLVVYSPKTMEIFQLMNAYNTMRTAPTRERAVAHSGERNILLSLLIARFLKNGTVIFIWGWVLAACFVGTTFLKYVNIFFV